MESVANAAGNDTDGHVKINALDSDNGNNGNDNGASWLLGGALVAVVRARRRRRAA